MPDGGSVIALTYLGSEKVIPGYNVMGVAKAALEATARYLAFDLGRKKIRVNTISAGPVETLSAMAVGGIDEMFDHVPKKAPLHRNIDGDEVGKTAVCTCSATCPAASPAKTSTSMRGSIRSGCRGVIRSHVEGAATGARKIPDFN